MWQCASLGTVLKAQSGFLLSYIWWSLLICISEQEVQSVQFTSTLVSFSQAMGALSQHALPGVAHLPS